MPKEFSQLASIRLAPGVGVESVDTHHAVLFQKHSGKRVKISLPLYDMLVSLRSPRPVKDIDAAGADFQVALAAMVARGLVADAEQRYVPAPRKFPPTAYTLFHSPART